ncbi:ABC transporter permease [Acrocarpospora catenulata]|uniref:ABC transporter permease n=1 Tax=Acrocarpospora catenulata TaxID=2836182 RepID=UPI0020239AE6|nr:ABC transporter permease [Acrocarpospora catenulata]
MSGVSASTTMSEAVSTRGTGRRRRRRAAPQFIIVCCFVFIAVVVLFAVTGSLLAPQDPSVQNLSNITAAPSAEHLLGTDALGRDTLSRLIAGTGSAFVGPLVIALGSFLIGNLLGLLAGYRGGRVDSLIMRWIDLMWAIPSLLILVVVAGVVGASYWPTVLILVVLTVPLDARVVRGATLEQMPRPYVEAAKTVGVSDRRIMWLHIWPNVAPISVANTFLVFAGSVGILASLSFLGLGVPPGKPDWGLMLAENQPLLFVQPLACLAPAVLIILTATSMTVIGDWAYERLSEEGPR